MNSALKYGQSFGKCDEPDMILCSPLSQRAAHLMQGQQSGAKRSPPVSYTHLDVYKRQALYGYGSREELEPFHPVLLAESCASLADQILNLSLIHI